MKPVRNLTLFLQQSVSVYHVTTELSGRFTYANELYRKIFFQDGQNFHDEFFQDSLFVEDTGLYKDAIEQCHNHPGENVCVDLRRTRKDGSLFWIRWEFCCFLCEDNSGIIEGIGTDISERKRAENEKKEVQQRLARERYLLRTVIDLLPDAIYVKDTESRHIINNKASVKLIGANNEEETLGKTVLDYLDDQVAQKMIEMDRQIMESGKQMSQTEENFMDRSGKKKWVSVTKVPLRKDNGEVIGLVGISRDITDEKVRQDQLAADKIASQRQITEATILAQERERAEMGRELHDNINQILTTTKMYLDMALSEKDISEELMMKSHENISTAIEEIRILSKSLVPPSLGDIGLKEAIQEMINNLRLSQKIDIRLRTSGLGKTAIPKNTQLMVFRIVQEQMNNVLKHSKATEVEIKIGVTRDSLTLAISDNGVGFDAKKRIKGIGLMNINSRTAVHDGSMEIVTSPGNGCTLKISIPIKN